MTAVEKSPTTVTCTNAGCDENGIAKPMGLTLHPGDKVQCGACGTVLYTEPGGPETAELAVPDQVTPVPDGEPAWEDLPPELTYESGPGAD